MTLTAITLTSPMSMATNMSFMDKEDYTLHTFTKDQIEEELLFMPRGRHADMQVLTWDGQLLALAAADR